MLLKDKNNEDFYVYSPETAYDYMTKCLGIPDRELSILVSYLNTDPYGFHRLGDDFMTDKDIEIMNLTNELDDMETKVIELEDVIEYNNQEIDRLEDELTRANKRSTKDYMSYRDNYGYINEWYRCLNLEIDDEESVYGFTVLCEDGNTYLLFAKRESDLYKVDAYRPILDRVKYYTTDDENERSVKILHQVFTNVNNPKPLEVPSEEVGHIYKLDRRTETLGL